MSVREELLSLVEQVTCQVIVPTVRQIYIPEPSIAVDKHAEFGLVELADGAAGLFYAWMGESQLGISDRYKIDDVVGTNAVDAHPANTCSNASASRWSIVKPYLRRTATTDAANQQLF